MLNVKQLVRRSLNIEAVNREIVSIVSDEVYNQMTEIENLINRYLVGSGYMGEDDEGRNVEYVEDGLAEARYRGTLMVDYNSGDRYPLIEIIIDAESMRSDIIFDEDQFSSHIPGDKVLSDVEGMLHDIDDVLEKFNEGMKLILEIKKLLN